MQAPRLVLASVLVGFWLTGCGASTFLAMQPARPNGPSMNGHPATRRYHPDSVEVTLHFVRYEKKELVFEVEIGNDSRRPVEVLPETFYYLPNYLAADTLATAQLPDSAAGAVGAALAAPALPLTRIMALDPESRLQQLAARLDKQASKAESGSWFELLTDISHVAEEISSIKKKETDQQIAEREQRHADDDAYFADQREQHAQQADELYTQKQSMEQVVLRKTVLQPGEFVRGQVYFPRTDAARQLRVVVFFDARPVAFDFTQK